LLGLCFTNECGLGKLGFGIIGLGYAGLPLALAFARQGDRPVEMSDS
jgi:UDP-N-acetyl-D-mannosaminuronate dehydrogenase